MEQRQREGLLLLFILCKETHGGSVCLAFHLYNRGPSAGKGGACVSAFHPAAPLLTEAVVHEPHPRSWAPRDARPHHGRPGGGGDNSERAKASQEGLGTGSGRCLQAQAPESGSLGSNRASERLGGFGQVAESL